LVGPAIFEIPETDGHIPRILENRALSRDLYVYLLFLIR
jgi:hypothetical protein